MHYPLRLICYPSMEREAAHAAYEALHRELPWHDGTFQSWAKERSSSHPYHFTHGVRVSVSDEDLAPWDTFTTERNASPLRPASSDS